MQPKPPVKPRNFYEPQPEGIEDNFVDEHFLQGLFPRSKSSRLMTFRRQLSGLELHFDGSVDRWADFRRELNDILDCKLQELLNATGKLLHTL